MKKGKRRRQLESSFRFHPSSFIPHPLLSKPRPRRSGEGPLLPLGVSPGRFLSHRDASWLPKSSFRTPRPVLRSTPSSATSTAPCTTARRSRLTKPITTSPTSSRSPNRGQAATTRPVSRGSRKGSIASRCSCKQEASQSRGTRPSHDFTLEWTGPQQLELTGLFEVLFELLPASLTDGGMQSTVIEIAERRLVGPRRHDPRSRRRRRSRHHVAAGVRLILAAVAGPLSGADTNSVTIKAADNSKTRIVASVDATGNRTSVSLDPT